jgi:hypothetical protein
VPASASAAAAEPVALVESAAQQGKRSRYWGRKPLRHRTSSLASGTPGSRDRPACTDRRRLLFLPEAENTEEDNQGSPLHNSEEVPIAAVSVFAFVRSTKSLRNVLCVCSFFLTGSQGRQWDRSRDHLARTVTAVVIIVPLIHA